MEIIQKPIQFSTQLQCYQYTIVDEWLNNHSGLCEIN